MDVTASQTTREVSVRFMGDLPSLLGKRDAQVAMPLEATVGDLLESLCGTFGDVFRNTIFSAPGKLRHTMLIFVGDENIKNSGGLAVKLGENTIEVIMLPMFGGG
jgi:molybdopterin converting factor small subunit